MGAAPRWIDVQAAPPELDELLDGEAPVPPPPELDEPPPSSPPELDEPPSSSSPKLDKPPASSPPEFEAVPELEAYAPELKPELLPPPGLEAGLPVSSFGSAAVGFLFVHAPTMQEPTTTPAHAQTSTFMAASLPAEARTVAK